jgi:serine phosphatase RsbU (regulator of sigma subunit)/putative methionine-R-sulfoxide reductase with GAF domain
LKAGSPEVDLSLLATWRQVLDLGERLLKLARQAFPDRYEAPIDLERLHASLIAQHDLIVETTTQLFHSQARLWLSPNILYSFLGRAAKNTSLGSPLSPLMQQALDELQACGGECTDTQPGIILSSQSDSSQAVEIQFIAAPLVVRSIKDEILGVLLVDRADGLPFSEEACDLFERVVGQITLALQAGLQMTKERWQLEQLLLVRQVSMKIANVRDLDELSRQVTDLIQRTFDYYYVAIFTLETGQDILHFRASAGAASATSGEGEGEVHSPNLVVHIGQGIIGQVAQTGQEILANDVRQEERYRHLDGLPETQSEVALPLMVEQRLVGVLDVQSDQTGYFEELDLVVLQALADNIASAIEGARLFSAVQQRAAQLSTVYEVSNAITSILDTSELLDSVVNLIQMRFGHQHVHLFTVHPGRRKIFYEAGGGPLSEILREEGFAYSLDDSHGLVPWVARHGEMVIANDVSQEPRYRPSVLPPAETLSELTVPLVFGGDVLGVLDVQSDRLYAFSEEDRFLFQALADNIAVAMRNAALYRSEVWRRQAADSLREVAGLLSADVDLDQVLTAIMTELHRNLPLDVAAVWLLEEDNTLEEGDPPALHLAAVRGDSLSDLYLEIGLSPEEVLDFNPATELGILPEQALDWLAIALDVEQPIVRTEHSSYDPLGAALGFPPDYSAIAAPLRVGQRCLGVLTLAHQTPGRYGGEARAMTATFASYAAVAIENTRLYEEAHEQAWVSTVLLQVAEATQSLTNLNELLETVIRITPTLAGVRACLLYILDEDGVFAPAVASGLNAEQQAEFERWRFASGDAPALDQLLAERQPVLLRAEEDHELASILLQGRDSSTTIHSELLVLVPLLAHGEIFGAFLVDYHLNLHSTNGAGLGTFFNERLAIIQGVAHQTAIAVENIRLLKSQKEEAYVSVALLQVAQAVVSSNELEEILGSIVRITPILVGVQRVVIFLWNDEHKVFRMSQTYGIRRDAPVCEYAVSEFPLLDAIYERDSLLAYPLPGGDGAFDNAPDDWSFLLPPDPEEVELILEGPESLLLAFPLSVKGRVLGVMLVQEPDFTLVDSLSSAVNGKRSRSKRLEIVTGISQQAALAIQNDMLQREMVERERLEREMQLAREIQSTFLPERVPELPGWDLKVRWRTAYEVGGDFYDFFEMPGNRLGLVIADVADKGMPAALYMTLVRTLLRATVPQVNSPAEALQRVNDILEPDAPRGMFVTLAYAVVSLDTGQVEFANAGHNPPLWVKSENCALERLVRGGMALGVTEGVCFVGRKFSLQPGDMLVMYTDGVTEAFSPEGDLFGEERLLEVIEQTVGCHIEAGQTGSAEEMLESIDQAVVSFMGSAAMSDDLTLLVIKRK